MAELLALDGVTAGYGDARRAGGRLARARRGRQPRAARPQRRRQDDAARHADGPHARCARGTLRWRGADLAALPTHRRAQRRARLGAAGALHVPVAHRRGAPDGGRAARAAGTSPRVYEIFPRLEERRGNYGNQLSGGEQQMLAIARALMVNPSAAAARRADGGPRADHRAGADGRDPRPGRRQRHGGDRRRAAREARAVADAAGDRARARPRRPSLATAKRCCATRTTLHRLVAVS